MFADPKYKLHPLQVITGRKCGLVEKIIALNLPVWGAVDVCVVLLKECKSPMKTGERKKRECGRKQLSD